MKFSSTMKAAAALGVTLLVLTGCASNDTPQTSDGDSGSKTTETGVNVKLDSALTGTITAGGSSAQANAEDAWMTAYNAQVAGVKITYDKTQGSGGGVTNFLSGSYDFAGSDSPLSADETTKSMAVCTTGGVNIPVYLDGVSIIFNIPGVNSLKLSGETIAKIFALQITDWSDPAITKDNGTALPAAAITTVARSDGSGTTQNLTNYLAATQSSVWTNPAGKNWPISGNVSLQKGGTGVVDAVKSTSGSIGYADHSAIGDLKAAGIIQNGKAIEFSAESVAKTFEVAATAASNGVAGDLSKKFDYSKLTADAYPIPLLSYAVVCSTFKDEAQAKATKSYLSFVASTAGQAVAAKNAKSAPLPESLLKDAQKTIDAIK